MAPVRDKAYHAVVVAVKGKDDDLAHILRIAQYHAIVIVQYHDSVTQARSCQTPYLTYAHEQKMCRIGAGIPEHGAKCRGMSVCFCGIIGAVEE